MVDRIVPGIPLKQTAYAVPKDREAWREEMLGRALAKVREVAPQLETRPARTAGPPQKGSLLDKYI